MGDRLRVRQCWVQLVGATDPVIRLAIVLNILKYCSAFPPVCLVAAQGLGVQHPHLLSYLAAAATLNSVYSFTVTPYAPHSLSHSLTASQWDVVMDWGLVSFTRGTCRPYLRQRTLFMWPVYPAATIINLLLRWRLLRLSCAAAVCYLVILTLVECSVLSCPPTYCYITPSLTHSLRYLGFPGEPPDTRGSPRSPPPHSSSSSKPWRCVKHPCLCDCVFVSLMPDAVIIHDTCR